MDEEYTNTSENEQPEKNFNPEQDHEQPEESFNPEQENEQPEESFNPEQPKEEEQSEENPGGGPLYEDPNANASVTDVYGPEQAQYQGQYQQQTYGREPYQQPYGQQPGTNSDPLSLGDSLIIMILFTIPCVNLIVAIVWACGGDKNTNRQNLGRAQLIVWGVILVLSLIFYAVFLGIIVFSLNA